MNSSRGEKDERILKRMIRLYCRKNHKSRTDLCPECRDLLQYSLNRYRKCRFGEEKPVCLKCPVHCYKSERRDQIRRIMRFSGPRMIFRHPLDALSHLIRLFRNPVKN